MAVVDMVEDAVGMAEEDMVGMVAEEGMAVEEEEGTIRAEEEGVTTIRAVDIDVIMHSLSIREIWCISPMTLLCAFCFVPFEGSLLFPTLISSD